MNSNNDHREHDHDNNQQQFQKPGTRPGYDNDKSQHLRAGPFDDNNGDTEAINDQNEDQDNLKKTERRWNEISRDYRRRYPNLTSDDIDYRNGEFDDMTERIAQRTNRSRQAVQDEIRNWDSTNDQK